jgi:hypothetical protein
MSSAKRWTPLSRESRTIPLHIPSGTAASAVLSYDASLTSSGTARSRISWSSSRAFTASEILAQSALGFAERRTSGFSGPALALLAPAAEPER